jgi:dGTPase
MEKGFSENRTQLPFPLVSYAFHTEETAGRRYPEPPHPYRTPFQRDRDRIIHCAAFRRLSGKMQVFTAEFGNYHRTRLTHTMEVVCIARTLGRALMLNEDLIEVAALLHDIGHPPFGHAGETVLDDLLRNNHSDGGFDHNGQALRIVEKLERRYAGFPGLNLSRELLDGQAFKQSKSQIPILEIQVVDMADSIAYDTHDVDDAMEIGLLETSQLVQTSLWKYSAERIRKKWTNLDDDEFRQAVVHDLIERQVSDVLQATHNRIHAAGITVSSEVLALPILVAPSSEISEQKSQAESFLLEQVYRHPKVMFFRGRIREWIETVFDYYAAQPELLQKKRYDNVLRCEGVARAVADFIGDQTDHSARREFLRAADNFHG